MVSGYNLKLRSSVAATQQGTGAVNVNGSPTRFYVLPTPKHGLVYHFSELV